MGLVPLNLDYKLGKEAKLNVDVVVILLVASSDCGVHMSYPIFLLKAF